MIPTSENPHDSGAAAPMSNPMPSSAFERIEATLPLWLPEAALMAASLLPEQLRAGALPHALPMVALIAGAPP